MEYEVNGIKYKSWSVKNQNIINKLIELQIFCCMTSEMEYMLSKIWDGDDDNPFNEDDYCQIMLPYCPECETTYGFDELTVADLKNEDFVAESGYNRETDEIEDGFLCPVCGFWHKTVENARECCGNDEVVYKCRECGKILSEDEYTKLDTKPEEVFEWWAVSNWFGEKLKEQGCIVIEAWNKSYWGRTTTGQAISLDGCIANIAKNMQILEGMEHEWDE